MTHMPTRAKRVVGRTESEGVTEHCRGTLQHWRRPPVVWEGARAEACVGGTEELVASSPQELAHTLG